MDGFWGNTLASLIGTFVGAGLALASTQYWTWRGERMRDRRLLQSVIDRLYRSRALAPDQTGGHGNSDRIDQDRIRCTRSVIATRNRIATVSDELSGHAKGTAPLNTMYVACLQYLTRADRQPDNYVDALMALRHVLEAQVDVLCSSEKGLHYRDPGTAQTLTGARRA